MSDDINNTSAALSQGVFIEIPAVGTSSCLGGASSIKTAFSLSFLEASCGLTGVDLTSVVRGFFHVGAYFSLSIVAIDSASRVECPQDATPLLPVLLSSSGINLLAFIFALARKSGDCISTGAARHKRSSNMAASSILRLFLGCESCRPMGRFLLCWDKLRGLTSRSESTSLAITTYSPSRGNFRKENSILSTIVNTPIPM